VFSKHETTESWLNYIGIFCPSGDIKKGKAMELCVDSNLELYCRKYHKSSKIRGQVALKESEFELHDCRVRGTGNIARALMAYLGVDYKFVEVKQHEYQELLAQNEDSRGFELLPFFIDDRKEFVCKGIDSNQATELRNDKKEVRAGWVD